MTHDSKIRVLCLAACVAAGGAGCASFSNHLTPRPTEKGKTEFHATADFIAFKQQNNKQQLLPNLEIGIRHGLSDRADIGGKLYAFGLELNSRVAIVRSDTFDVGVVPGASAAFVSYATTEEAKFLALAFGMPLLFGLRMGGAGQLVFGPRLGAQIATQTNSNLSDASGVLTLQPGGTLGVQLDLGDNFALFPEVNVIYPYNTDRESFEKPQWQGGLSFQFLVN